MVASFVLRQRGLIATLSLALSLALLGVQGLNSPLTKWLFSLGDGHSPS